MSVSMARSTVTRLQKDIGSHQRWHQPDEPFRALQERRAGYFANYSDG